MSGTTSSVFQGAPTPPQPTGSDASTSFPLWQQQYIYNLSNAATNLAGSPYTPNPYQAVATPSQATQTAWNMALNNAYAGYPQLQAGEELTQQAAQPIGASQINQYLNPYTNDVVGALQQASNNNFFQNVMPGIQSQFVSAGQAASPQEMQSANNAAYLQSQALNQATAGALQQGYQGALNTAMGEQAYKGSMGAQMGQLGAVNQTMGQNATGLVASSGQAQDTYNQSVLNNNASMFNQALQWPYQNLGFASDIMRGQQVPTNSMTVGMNYSPGQVYTPSPLSSFVGTSMGAQALSNGTANPYGAMGLGMNAAGYNPYATGYARGGRVQRRRFADGGDVTVSPYSGNEAQPLTLDEGDAGSGALGAMLAANAPAPLPAPAVAPVSPASGGALSSAAANSLPEPPAPPQQSGGALSQPAQQTNDQAAAIQRAMMVMDIANGGRGGSNLPMLAAAGAMLRPTRTGGFAESLGNAFSSGAGAIQAQRALQENALLRQQQMEMNDQWRKAMIGVRAGHYADMAPYYQARAAMDSSRASYLQGKAALEQATHGRWTYAGVDPKTNLPIMLNTVDGTTKLGDRPIGMKPGDAVRAQGTADVEAGRSQRATDRNRTTFIDSYMNSHPSSTPAQADTEWQKLHPSSAIGAGASGVPGAPKIGTIEGGHVYRGGNPADPNSWAPVQ